MTVARWFRVLTTRPSAANRRTVVVVNAAAPVRMPWATEVAAILHVSFGGQEMANALLDRFTGGRRVRTTQTTQLQTLKELLEADSETVPAGT